MLLTAVIFALLPERSHRGSAAGAWARLSDRTTRFVLWIGGAIVGAFLMIALAGSVNCIFFGRTCPVPGAIREILEDTFVALIGFAGGRLTAAK